METRYFVTAVVVVIVAVTLTWLIFIPHPDKYDEFDNLAGVGAGLGPDLETEGYASRELGFSVDPPAGFSIDETHVSEGSGSGARIPGVAFYPPRSVTAGTNLSPDSFVSVETLVRGDCVPSSFILTDDPGRRVTLGGRTYAYAESRTAGAGNFYEEAAYVTSAGGRCVSIRRFTHFTNIANYPSGTVREFDRDVMVRAAEALAGSLVIR